MMKALLHKAWEALFPLPQVGALEALLSRLLVAYAMWYFYPIFTPPAVQPAPVGLAHFFDLTWLGDPAVLALYKQGFIVILCIYAAGLALPVTLPVLAIMQILPYTLINSQGFTNHSHNILSVTLMAQALVAVCHLRGAWLQPNARMNAWLLAAAQAGIACTYLISVCSKMIASGGTWLFKSHYIALDLVKTMRQNYYSQLEPRYATEPEGVVWMLQHPKLTALVFDSGFFIEALIVLAVGTRRLAFIFGVFAILMHRSINYLMGLEFHQNEAMLAVFFVNVPFLLAMLWVWGERKVRGLR
jgi:hypothetical protein